MEIKSGLVSNIRVVGQAVLTDISCPQCNKLSRFVVHAQSKFTAERICYGCGAILAFDCQFFGDEPVSLAEVEPKENNKEE